MTSSLPVDYDSFFGLATDGQTPHDFQRRVVSDSRLPDVIDVPPGLGKTASIVIAWLWLRFGQPDHEARRTTSRRLVFALPMRALTDQTARSVTRWIAALGLTDEVGVYVVMGGSKKSISQDWRSNPDKSSIIIGTIDVLVSKALMRGYGTSRGVYPMDAALMWNDAHLVIDEVQLAPASTRTLRQIDAFRRASSQGHFGAAGLTCMSATVEPALLDTVDNLYPSQSRIVGITAADDDPDVLARRNACRRIRQLEVGAGDFRKVAARAVELHRPATLTLVLANTVAGARAIHQAVVKAKPAAQIVLLHSQFRPHDRRVMVEDLDSPPPTGGRIVVSTQVVEAGIDIDADVLITEAAPWPSLVQRVGRCNRAGRTSDASVYWYPAKAGAARSGPYERSDVAATEAQLVDLQDRDVTSSELLACDVEVVPLSVSTLRKPDFLSLFDTSPDISGNDLDIAPFIRDADDVAAQLCWMHWDGVSPGEAVRPLGADWRCRAPLNEVMELAARVPVWRKDPTDGRWGRVGRTNRARPGELLLVAARDGGYRHDTGLEISSTAPVDVPGGAPALPAIDPTVESGNSADEQSFGCSRWIPLDQHLRESAEEARILVDALGIDEDLADDLVLAARLHDVGKAHPTWQDALCGLAADDAAAAVSEGRPWAKSDRSTGHLHYGDATGFRHELASVALLQGALAELLEPAHDHDLVLYLILAHHGKLRVTVRELGYPAQAGRLLGLADGPAPDLPAVLGVRPRPAAISIRQFGLGGDVDAAIPAWVDRVEHLIERYGVFRLAYLELIVRVADWRASALHSHGGEVAS